MAKLIQIAFRNIFRNKRRTVITLTSIILGLIVLIFVNGLLGSLSDGWSNLIIKADLGNIQVMAKGIKKEENVRSTIPDKNVILKHFEKYPSIVNHTERINIGGLISTGNETQIFYGAGVDPESTLEVLPKITKNIKEGRFIYPGEKNGAVIGKILAEKLKVKINDIIMLVTNDKYGSLNAVDIRIVGISSFSTEQLSKRMVLVHIDNAKTLLNYDENEVSSILLSLNNNRDSIKMTNILSKELKNENVEVYSWFDLADFFSSVQSIWTAVSSLLTTILLVLTLISIMNSVLMSVFERIREIGTIMAIGSSRLQVVAIFLFESFFIGVFGAIIGAILGVLIIFVVNLLGGVHLPPPPAYNDPIILKPIIKFNQIVLTCVFIIITSVIGGLYPANHAAKQKPVDALRST